MLMIMLSKVILKPDLYQFDLYQFVMKLQDENMSIRIHEKFLAGLILN